MPQISASISPELKEKIQEIASQRERSFSEMVSLLLLQAVKEIDRQRNKNATKKVHS
jgi:predicted transcriptional regulator